MDGLRVFDRTAVRRHRDRAAAGLERHAFLLEEVGARLVDRLDDIRRRFPLALDLGCHTGQIARLLHGRGGVRTLISADLAPAMAMRAPVPAVVADEEALPFAAGTFDLILSLLSLHWVNDLPGALVQARQALKPDGLFLAALLGGETLKELRAALTEAEIACEGGVSPRVSPFADVRDMGDLLQRAGFALPVVDTESVTVSYGDAFALMADLRGMGESNAVRERRPHLSRRATLMDGAARYGARFADGEGRISATFQVIYLTAWAPAPSQQQPARRGSGTFSLVDALAPTPSDPSKKP